MSPPFIGGLQLMKNGLSLYWMLGDAAAQLPLAAGSIFALLAWIGIPLLAIATAFPWSRTRKRSRLEKAGAVARLVFGLIGMAALALLTDVGILLAGHSYWIDRAFTARTDAESRRCLRVVLGSTQYGRDLVANGLAGLPPGERRRELEVAFGEMTDLPRRGPEKIGR